MKVSGFKAFFDGIVILTPGDQNGAHSQSCGVISHAHATSCHIHRLSGPSPSVPRSAWVSTRSTPSPSSYRWRWSGCGENGGSNFSIPGGWRLALLDSPPPPGRSGCGTPPTSGFRSGSSSDMVWEQAHGTLAGPSNTWRARSR